MKPSNTILITYAYRYIDTDTRGYGSAVFDLGSDRPVTPKALFDAIDIIKQQLPGVQEHEVEVAPLGWQRFEEE